MPDMADDEPITLQDLVDLARKRASALAASPVAQDARQIATGLLGLGRDQENWTALAIAVDELVEVVLFQQRLIEELLGVPGAPDLRFSRLVEQARAARNGSGAPAPAVPRQATPSR
jgi:hypothetical protein